MSGVDNLPYLSAHERELERKMARCRLTRRVAGSGAPLKWAIFGEGGLSRRSAFIQGVTIELFAALPTYGWATSVNNLCGHRTRMFGTQSLGQTVPSEVQTWHELAMKDPRWNLSQYDVDQCLPYVSPRREQPTSLIGNLRQWLQRVPPNETAVALYQIVIDASRHEDLLRRFQIDPADYNAVTYFAILHAWIINTALNKHEETAPLSHFWQLFWNEFEALLHEAGVKHSRQIELLHFMQNLCINLMLELDGIFDEAESTPFGGRLRSVIIRCLYNGNQQKAKLPPNDKALHDLTVYVLRLYRFGMVAPIEAVLDGNFNFPPWEF